MSERLVIGAAPKRRLPVRRGAVVALLVLGLGLLVVRLVFYEVVRVRGNTMAPAVLDGDLLLIASLTAPKRGDMVLLEAGGRAVLRRVIGLPGERIGTLDGDLTLDGVPLATTEDGLYSYRGTRSDHPVRQRQVIEALPGGRRHRVLGDHDGAARPWHLDVPELEIGPGQLFVLCDNRRTCPLDELAGVVPADEVAGVVATMVGQGRGRLDEPGDYGAELRSTASSTDGGSGDETTASPRK